MRVLWKKYLSNTPATTLFRGTIEILFSIYPHKPIYKSLCLSKNQKRGIHSIFSCIYPPVAVKARTAALQLTTTTVPRFLLRIRAFACYNQTKFITRNNNSPYNFSCR